MKNHDDEIVISYFLKAGVMISVSFLIVGVIILFAKNGGDGYTLAQMSNYNYALAHGIDSKSVSLNNIWSGLSAIDGLYFITVGLWVLIFTPITVVFIGWLSFFEDKNYLYVGMASIVLFNLFFAMLVIPRFIV
jgi:uncharacterized membrane protein